jgi:hypothetical protein
LGEVADVLGDAQPGEDLGAGLVELTGFGEVGRAWSNRIVPSCGWTGPPK